MELSQIEQMVRWLDEERKKEKAALTALQGLVEQQNHTIEAQAREIKELRQQLGMLETDIRRTDDYPALVEKAQRDLRADLDEMRNQLQRELAESSQMWRTSLEALQQEVIALDRRVKAIPRLEEAVRARLEGEQRLQSRLQQLAAAFDDFTKRTEDRLQAIVYLEEQRRADLRRITTLESDVSSLRQEVGQIPTRLARLEEGLRKATSRTEEVMKIVKSYDPKIEALRVADFQREQRVKKYLDQAAQVDQELARLVKETQKYTLLFNQNQQALAALEDFRARLETRQNEMLEILRLNEERMKRQWEEWQESFSRDWQRRLIAEEDRWRRQELANQQMEQTLGELNEDAKLYYEEIMALWKELQESMRRWEKAVQGLTRDNTTVSQQHLKTLRQHGETRHKELL